MNNDSSSPRPSWINGACIGMGIAFGTIAMRNGMGLDSRALQIAAGAVVAVIVALIALSIAGMLMKKRE